MTESDGVGEQGGGWARGELSAFGWALVVLGLVVMGMGLLDYPWGDKKLAPETVTGVMVLIGGIFCNPIMEPFLCWDQSKAEGDGGQG